MCLHNIIKIIMFAVFALLFTIVFISDFISINFNKVKHENKKKQKFIINNIKYNNCIHLKNDKELVCMCNNCKNDLKLISFKWDTEENTIIYKYQCKKCGELKTKCGILSDKQLKDILINEEMYNNYNI